MSDQLYWEILRNTSCFLVRRNGVEFSTEPNNVANRHTCKYSGIVSSKAVGVTPAANGKGAVLTYLRTKASPNHPSSRQVTIPLNKQKSSINAIKAVIGQRYCPKLAKKAITRYQKILESQKPGKVLKQKKPRGKKTASKK